MHSVRKKSQSSIHRPPLPIRVGNRLIWLLRLSLQKTLRTIKRILNRSATLVGIQPALKNHHDRRALYKLLKNKYGYSPSPLGNELLRVVLLMRDGTTYPKSSAFIRLIAPFTHPFMKDKVSFTIVDSSSTQVPAGTDICIVQRTAFDTQIAAAQLVQNLKLNGTKLVVDNDDAFSLLDESHAEHSTKDQKHEALEYLLKKADQVWVSTNALAKLYKDQASSIHVIKNTLDERIWKHDISPATGDQLQMVYMGTATHDADFDLLMNALDIVERRFPGKFQLTVIGVSSRALPDRPWIHRLYQPPGGAIYPNFVDWFVKQGPFDLGLCPLIDTPFNSCKSDIKCLDYIALGALPVASNVPAYKTRGLDKYIIKLDNTEEAWIEGLTRILRDIAAFRKQRHATITDAQTYLWSKRSSEVAARDIYHKLSTLNRN